MSRPEGPSQLEKGPSGKAGKQRRGRAEWLTVQELPTRSSDERDDSSNRHGGEEMQRWHARCSVVDGTEHSTRRTPND